MTSRGLTSSARGLATLRVGGKKGVVPQQGFRRLPAPSTAATPSPATQLLLRSKQPVAVFSRSRSTRPRPGSGSELAAAGGSNAPVTAEQDHLALAKPLDFDFASKIDGQESQMVTFELQPGQVIRVSHQRRGVGCGTEARFAIAPTVHLVWQPDLGAFHCSIRRIKYSSSCI